MDLDHAIEHARKRYAAARPGSERWATRAAAVMPGGNTRSVLHFDPFPFRVAHAEGPWLTDVDGHRYLDLLGNYTAGLLGHSPAAVRAAAHAAIDNGFAIGAVHPNEVRLAELIVDRYASIERVRFTNSGTEANLMALAAATHHTGRRAIMVFRGGYHGGVLTFGGHGEAVNVPHRFEVATYNDLADVEARSERLGDDLAAVVVEPMQGSGGCIAGAPEFLRGLRSVCDRTGALLIFDEVMTSRLARGGMQQLVGVVPDLTTLGKYLGGGFGFGAFGGRRDPMAAFDVGGPLGHAGTFNNNVVTMAAGVAALETVLSDDVVAATNARGDRLREGLRRTFAEAGIPMCVTGVGSLMNVHGTPGPVTSADDLRNADDRWRELFFFDAMEAGFFVARRGFIALSIEVTDADVDRFLAFADEFSTGLSRSRLSRSGTEPDRDVPIRAEEPTDE
jgi:glutamate-1-semialdehyde 2,1-aminomutase